MTTAALTLETWLDPPLQAYLAPRVINWHAAIVDPYTHVLTAPPAGTAVSFQWTNPPVVTVPQVVAPVVNDSTGAYHVNLPLTAAMVGKLLLRAILSGGGVQIDEATQIVVVYGSGQ